MEELYAEITFSMIDNRPIDVSPGHKVLSLLVGKRTAERWTYVDAVKIISRHPPPNGDDTCGRSSGAAS